MATFVRSVEINAPVSEVFAFHEREDALDLLSPAFPPVKMVKKSGHGIDAGVRVELRVGFLPWLALHTVCEKDRLFVDEQIKGPFQKWVHRHEFEASGSGCRLTDRVEYELPGSLAILSWAVKPGLMQMFRHRHRVTKQFCEHARDSGPRG